MTAIELLNKYLPIFGKAGEYLKLIGDFEGKKLQIYGDSLLQIKSLTLNGVTISNTDTWKLGWSIKKTIPGVTILITKSSGTVAQAINLPDSGIAILSAVGGSGITGTIQYAWTQDDFDSDNIIRYGREPIEGLVKINDMTEGALANGLEYIRHMVAFLLRQLNINTATEDWLDFIFTNFYAFPRRAGETDADYVTRVKAEITTIKITPQMIRVALEEFGDNVQIIEGGVGGAFSEVSFSDSFRDFTLLGQWVVKNATTFREGLLVFYFKVIMDNVDPLDYSKIIQTIKKYKSAGISYDVEIN